MLSSYFWDNIAQVKSFCNVIKTAPDNIAQEKIVFNVALIFLGQHCTGKTLYNVVQKPPGNIRPKKILFNVALILLGQHCTGKNFLQ